MLVFWFIIFLISANIFISKYEEDQIVVIVQLHSENVYYDFAWLEHKIYKIEEANNGTMINKPCIDAIRMKLPNVFDWFWDRKSQTNLEQLIYIFRGDGVPH